MSTKAASPPADPQPSAKGGKKKLLFLALPAMLVALGAGFWFSGMGPRLLGHRAHASSQTTVETTSTPVFVDLPDIVANLDSPPHHQMFIKLKVKIELAKAADQAALTAAMPRILDLLQTYLRDMRPEDLRGSAGTYRLREELIARANIALAPSHVNDLLFTDMLIQ
jgi:flagellar FliL protein